jgi:HPt (histidine-containing phosphotransfer) domain-containing protein
MSFLSIELEPHLNLEHLQQISEGCREFERELIEIFLEDSHHHLQVLRQAIAATNLLQIYQTAHHLKGSSANVGASGVQSIAARLENHYAPGKNFSASFSPELLVVELEASLHHIQSWLFSLKLPGLEADSCE